MFHLYNRLSMNQLAKNGAKRKATTPGSYPGKYSVYFVSISFVIATSLSTCISQGFSKQHLLMPPNNCLLNLTYMYTVFIRL